MMMKKIWLLILVLLVFWCAGCGESPNKPYVLIRIDSIGSRLEASAIVVDSSNQQLTDAIVTVDGNPIPVGGFSYNLPGVTLGTPVNVHISHEKIGTIDQTITIPDQITTLAVIQPSDTSSWLNNDDTLTLNWMESDSNEYYITGIPFDSSNSPINSNSISRACSHAPFTIDSATKATLLSASGGNTIAHVKFSIRQFNTISLPGYRTGSKIEAANFNSNIVTIP
jgi:hypothetical protein